MNDSKTERVVFSLRATESDNSGTVKFLGITLDDTLIFQTHVDGLAARLSKSVYLLKNLIKFLPLSVCLQTYHAVFQSVATYAILVWGHSCHSDRIFALQRRAVRVLAGLGYRDDARIAFTRLGILTIPCKYIFECLVYTYKNIDKYSRNGDCHNYPTRVRQEIRVNYLRLNRSRISTNYYGPILFNKLSDRLKSLPLSIFKSKLKDLLHKVAYYSVDEFLKSDIIFD